MALCPVKRRRPKKRRPTEQYFVNARVHRNVYGNKHCQRLAHGNLQQILLNACIVQSSIILWVHVHKAKGPHYSVHHAHSFNHDIPLGC